jgi:hypothetical protein
MQTVFDKLLLELDELEDTVPEFAQKVEPVYRVLDWKWDLDKYQVPTVADIKNFVYSLIRDLRGSLIANKRLQKKPLRGFDTWFFYSGGIRVSATHYEDGEISVTLKMEIDV